MTAARQDDAELHALRALSAALGGDPLRTQAAGGNTSIKRDGVMWIKASGAWLADAMARQIMTPVLLQPLREAMASGDPRAENAGAFVAHAHNGHGLRPSIETCVHAALPHRVVIHIHCVDTIAFAVRSDGETAVAARLGELPREQWSFVPYAKPGLQLAMAICGRLTAQIDVLILGNHGLLVGAATVAAAERRIAAICGAFAARPGEAPATDLGRLSRVLAGSDYRLPHDAAAHATALDPKRLAIARLGSLYPDHVVFLGAGIVEGVVVDGRTRAPTNQSRASMIVLPGLGVAISRSAPRGVDEMARCLADVTGRIPVGAPVTPLTVAQERELVDWEAEKYRRALNATEARAP